jgi:hypothetical protein
MAYFKIQSMMDDKVIAGQLDFGCSKPFWSLAFHLVETNVKKK